MIVEMKYQASRDAQGKVLFRSNVPEDLFAFNLSFCSSEEWRDFEGCSDFIFAIWK